ncbi:WXG100 family type VII secretion target [Streptomyces sp. NPDC059679]|uniref:WXG100 family type VII secretion target n=1 Tax=Streptomyces sp. NPDC059679 TaxID=3346903 RepID=UPI00367DACC4
MSKQRVSDDAFRIFTNELDQSIQGFASNMKLMADILATVDSGWQGQGAGAFKKAQMDLEQDHDAVRRLVDGIREAVALTHRASGANDDDIASQLKGIDVNGAAAGGHITPGSGVGGLGAGTDAPITSYSKVDGF